MSNKRIRAKNWVFTLNNYTEEDENRLKELDCKWIIFGHEEAPETGTKHLQGAVCFEGKRDFNALQKLFKWHLEIMHGSPQDSKTYCTKEDPLHYFESGEMPKGRLTSKSKKIDWEEVYQLAIEGKFEEIRRDVYLRYYKNLKQLYFDNRVDSDMNDMDNKELKKHFLWIWGPTGTGKSHTARRIASELGCDKPYLKGLNKWWNGYDYQKVTIIEEADPKHCEFLAYYFKQWCDKWSFTAEVKGNEIPACRPEYIIVTSNYDMMTCFPTPDDYVPMKRRMTEVKIESRDFHLYWPLTQEEFEAKREEEERARAQLDLGNTNQVQSEAPGVEPEAEEEDDDTVTLIPSEQEEVDEDEIIDIDSPSEDEYLYQMAKKRKTD